VVQRAIPAARYPAASLSLQVLVEKMQTEETLLSHLVRPPRVGYLETSVFGPAMDRWQAETSESPLVVLQWSPATSLCRLRMEVFMFSLVLLTPRRVDPS
jgi:hypothetical protein